MTTLSASDVARVETPPRRRRLCLERTLSITTKACLLTTQRVFELKAIIRLTDRGLPTSLESSPFWFWSLLIMLAVSTLLSMITLQRHRCACRANRPYGYKIAALVALLQISPLVEMFDKVCDQVCLKTAPSPPRLTTGNPMPFHQSRLSENSMRGLRKLSVACMFSALMSTVFYLRILFSLLAQHFTEYNGLELENFFGIYTTIIASLIGLFNVSVSWSDLVLYMWVGDAFVRTHKNLVIWHYLVETIARLPTLVGFLVTSVYTDHGFLPIVLVISCDLLASVVLFLVPMLITFARGRPSCNHFCLQLMTALGVSGIIAMCNIFFFDSTEAWYALKYGVYFVRYVEVIFMVKRASAWWDTYRYARGAGRNRAVEFFETCTNVIFVIHLLNFAIVCGVVPYMRRRMKADALRRRDRDTESEGAGFGATSTFAYGIRPPKSVTEGGDGLELESIAVHNSSVPGASLISTHGLRSIGNNGYGVSLLGRLGDTLDALCLLSQSQSERNSAIVSGTMIVNVLWSLLLPWEGLYEDNHGGHVRLVVLDARRCTLLVQILGGAPTSAYTHEDLPRRQGYGGAGGLNRSARGGGDTVAVELVAVVIQGTVLEVVLEGQGHVLGTRDGRRIHFTDECGTTWTKKESGDADSSPVRRQSLATGIAVASAMSEGRTVLSLLLPQLVLALRWEPTHIGLGPGIKVSSDAVAAIDASQRPLLTFLIRYALAARDAELISEIYWMLWCLSRDKRDKNHGVYEKSRWILVIALRGEVEFWEGARGIRLNGRGEEDADFRCRTLQLLRRQSTVWRQSAMLARLAKKAEGDAVEKTRVVQDQLSRICNNSSFDSQGDDDEETDQYLDDAENPCLADEGFFQGLSMPIDPGALFCGVESCEVLQSNACPIVLNCKVSSPQPKEVDQTSEIGTARSISITSLPQSAMSVRSADEIEKPVPPTSWTSRAVAIAGVAAARRPLPSDQATAAPLLASSLAPPSPPRFSRENFSFVSCQGQDRSDDVISMRRYMVKVGDDLRQDQFVLQMFALMERVWRENLRPEDYGMLTLSPYRVLAMTPDAGFIKFVPNAVSLSKALRGGNLVDWLDTHRPASLSLEQALQNLCGSVAAYSVATYVLGIGDRHLDNLQITPDGHFFHIDFGFILGSDPKPFAPRLRLPLHVANALLGMPAPGTAAGVVQGENLLDRCLLLSGRAYIALRRSMSLWMPLLRVIGEAGGAGCHMPRSDAAMVFVHDRLRSDLGEYEEQAAATDFLLMLCENVEALYPMLTDKVHQLGLFWK